MGQRAAVKNEHSFKMQRNRCESATEKKEEGKPITETIPRAGFKAA